MIHFARIDTNLVKRILTDKELFERVAEDGVNPDEFEPDPSYDYVGAFVDGEIIGFLCLHPDTSTTMHFHVNILKDYRKHAAKVISQFLDGYKKSAADRIKKLSCKIPVIYQDVYHFALKMNFKLEGVDERSIMKNGELVDRYCLGYQLGD